MTPTVLTPPTAEPVSLAEAKAHLRVTFDEEDALIARLIAAARERVETELGLCLVETRLREQRPAWPIDADGAVRLGRGPLIAVDAVEWTVVGGMFAPFAFSADLGSRPARVTVAASPWAALRSVGALRIDYRAGFGPTAASVPETLRQAVLALVADAFERRGEGGGALGAAEPWLAPWRRLRL